MITPGDFFVNLLEDKELYETIKINAKELLIKNYNWDLIAKKMEDIFNNIISLPFKGRAGEV